MAFRIKLKSSTTTKIPASSDLISAELAYSFVTGDSDGGDRLYIGYDDSSVVAIGGKYYTDMMDHTKGAVKASSAIITDANNKIDQLNVDTLSLDSSTISTTGFHLFLNTNSTFVKLDNVQIKDVADPTLAQDAATKAYVDASILTKDNTDEIAEGTNNLYYTTTRADSDFDVRLGTKSTSDLAEGSNLYYTTTRADSDFDTRLGTKSTSNIAEGSNLFHTTARARAAVSVTDAGGDGSLSYDSSTGVFTYTGPNAAEVRAHLTANKGLSVLNGEFNIDSANVRGMFSAAGDLSYNSGTGQFSFDVEDVYTKANFDSDLTAANTGQLPEGSNLYYTDARVTSHVDSAYVRLRQDYSYSSITGAPTVVDGFDSGKVSNIIIADVDKAFVDNLGTNADTLDGYQAQFFIDKIDSNTAGMLDSVEAIALIDSAYVRARVKTDQDLLSTSTVTFGQIRGPENFIIDPAAIGDNTGTVQILGNLQVEGTQTTINSTTVSINDKNIVLADSAANAAAADGAGITINGAAATLTYAASGDKFVFNKPIEGNILGFDSDFTAKSTDDLTEGSTNKYFNGKTTTDLPEGTNLYYTKVRADSDIAASLNDSGNTVSITITNTITDQVDSDYVLARVAEAPFLDSANATQLVDAAYVQARQTLYNTSDFVDSAYVEANSLDSERTINLIDSAYIQLRDTPQDFAYGSLTGTPTIPTFGTDFVDSAYVEANSIDSARTINLIDSAYVAARTTAGTDSAAIIQLIDSAYVAARAETVAPFSQIVFEYTSDSGQTVFTGSDNNSNTLSFSSNKIGVYLNGLLLSPVQDYSVSGGNTVTLATAPDSGGELFVNAFSGNNIGVDSGFVTNTIDSAYIQFRQSSVGSGGLDSALTSQLIDSAYIQFRQSSVGSGGLDSALTSQLIDSAYVAARTTAGTDSAAIIQLIDSAYVAARTSAGTDSATVISLINSTVHDSDVAINLNNLVELGLGKNVTQNTYTSVNATVTGSRYDDGSTSGYSTAHPYLQVSSLTNFLAGMDSGEAIWVSSDGVNFTNPSSVTWTGGYKTTSGTGQPNLIQLSTNVNFWTYNGQTVYSGADVIRRSLRLQGDSSSSKIIASKNLSIEGDNGATITVAGYNIKDSADVTNIIDSDYVSDRIHHTFNVTNSGTDHYSFTGYGFPSAANDPDLYMVRGETYHFVVNASGHPFYINTVSGTGSGNAYSTGVIGNGADTDTVKFTVPMDAPNKLFYNCSNHSAMAGTIYIHNNSAYLDSSEVDAIITALGGVGLDSALALNVIDSAYISGIVDSAYISGLGFGTGSGGTDSAAIIQLIDSDYVRSRSNFGAGEYKQTRTEFTADSGQTLFDTLSSTSLQTNDIDVFINGILQIQTTDYTVDSSAVTLIVGADSADTVSIVERKGTVLTQRGLQLVDYHFATSTPTTAFTGTDDNGATLDISVGFHDVFLNGILLKDSDDYAVNAAGTSVTLTSATDSSDLVTIRNSKGIIVTPNLNSFEYVADSGQTVFTGNDINSKSLSYVPNSIATYLNGILLKPVIDYTAINGTSITLTSAADSADEVAIQAFAAPGPLLTTYKYTADSAQTTFGGKDLSDLKLQYEPGNIQVFLNGLLLNDSDDYVANNSIHVVLNTAATINDELKISSFNTISNVDRDNLTYRTWSAPTGTVSAVAGNKLFIDTSGGARTVNLPSTASQGDEIRIIDVTGNAGTNNITIGRNGHSIQGAASDLTININRTALGLVYYDVTQGWLLIEN